jgi:O-antigen ligase
MDQLFWMVVLSLTCLVLPVKHLILLGVVGVALSDTRFVSYQLIYYLRFIPMGILCFRILADLKYKRFFRQRSYSLVKVWTPFLLFALLSATYSLQPSLSIQRILSAGFVLIGLGLGIPVYFADKRKITQVLKLISIVMAGAILYSLSLAPWHESIPSEVEDYERLYGIFRNPNMLGLLAMQLIFILIYFWQQKKGAIIGKVIFAVAVGVGATMIASGSRASALGFSVGLLIFICGNARIQKSTLPAVMTVVLILVSIFLVVGYFFPEYSGGLFRTDSAGRSDLWNWTWKAYKNGPFLGVGFGGSGEVFARDALYLRSQGLYAPEAHNSFLSLLLEVGFIGVSFALCGFVILVMRAWRFLPYFEDPKLGVALMAAIFASLINSVFETWVFNFGNASTVPFWLFVAMISHQTAQAQLRTRYAFIRKWRVNAIDNAELHVANRVKLRKPQLTDSRTN